jgi:prepilin signal peptidase PulO-like enzyme (type II secretory pathway)
VSAWAVGAYGVIGAVVGSFLNVCADRLPAGESIVTPGSHCANCQRPLTAWELIPVFSYVLLRGRCRSCGVQIGLRSPLVELLTGGLFALTLARFGLSTTSLLVSAYVCFLMVMAITDLEGQRILNSVVLPAIGLALLASFFTPGRSWVQLLLGGAVGFVVLFLLAVLVSGGMGMGDVKLAAFIGLIVGFPQIGLVLVLAFVMGGLIAGSQWAAGRLARGDRVAFGPYLALGAVIGLLYGNQLLALWLGRIS